MVLADLRPGHVFKEHAFQITQAEAAAYAAAVGDTSPLAGEGRVPPMMLIASGLSLAIKALSLGGGTVHTSQEVSLHRPVATGERIVARATLRGNSVRRGSRFATVETEFISASDETVARSVSMVIVPE